MDDFAYMFIGQAEDAQAREGPPSLPSSLPSSLPTTRPSTPTIPHRTAATPGSSKTPARLQVDGAGEDNASAPPSPTDSHHPHSHHRSHQHHHSLPEQETPKKRRGIRDFLSKASLQDQLLDKLFQQVIPTDGMIIDDGPDRDQGDAQYGDHVSNAGDADGAGIGAVDESGQRIVSASAEYDPGTPKKERPGFSVPIMSNNFRRFNARIGVVFRFQKKVERLLVWRHPPHTLAFLGVYTFVCLDPYLLTLVAPAVVLLTVLIPGYIARHPGTPTTSDHYTAALQPAITDSYYARGPPLAPPRTVKPVKELSRDFFRNMGDLQNSMEDFSVAHDQVVELLVPATNFSDERFSSALFVVLCSTGLVLSVGAHLVPWRQVFLVGGWLAVCGGHPALAKAVRMYQKSQAEAAKAAVKADPSAPPAKSSSPLDIWNEWVTSDIILDEAPETREVEIFELQRRSATASEWEPWVFSPNPFDPLSAPRIASRDAKPSGSRFFEDVQPPYGWRWSEKKWALDLWSRDWVEERIITGVEVETEGERWVYDMYTEHEQRQRQQHVAEAAAAGLVRDSGIGEVDAEAADNPGMHDVRKHGAATKAANRGPSWEEIEGEEEATWSGRRGEWRRRRWVRMVKRKRITAEE